jgi:thioredoxin reductase (NADPH)
VENDAISSRGSEVSEAWDVLVLGGGPAGLTAGLYTSRAAMKTLLFEKLTAGGQAATTDLIDNYPGFPEGIAGSELSRKMEEHAVRFGLQIKHEEVKDVEVLEKGAPRSFKVKTDRGTYRALSVILAPGAEWNKLGVPGEEEFRGKGVSYCATCDGPFFRNQELVVVGGGDTAVEEGTYLTKFASKVTIVHRRDRLRAIPIIQERAFANSKVEFSWNTVVDASEGEKGGVEGVRLRDVKTGGKWEKRCAGVFIFVGMIPNTQFLKGGVELDERGYIVADDDMNTSVEGIFACGDARKKILRQVITACGEGATAAFSAQHYVETLKGTAYE